MTRRPAPRKSAIANASPVQSAAAPAPAPARNAKPKKEKVSFYLPAVDADRLRATVVHTMGIEGHRSLSDFITAAVMARVEALELEHHDGTPFPIGTAVAKGRPIGG